MRDVVFIILLWCGCGLLGNLLLLIRFPFQFKHNWKECMALGLVFGPIHLLGVLDKFYR